MLPGYPSGSPRVNKSSSLPHFGGIAQSWQSNRLARDRLSVRI